MMLGIRRHRCDVLAVVLLATLVATVYGQVAGHQFVAWDDTSYVSENPLVAQGLRLEGIRLAFTEFQLSNWHPLTLMSHMLDVTLWGLSPGHHALTNAFLHGLNVILLYGFLRRLPPGAPSIWPAALVAALWAVHPLHVESVAWIAERKDVLCALFWLLAMHAYLDWRRQRSIGAYLRVSVAIVLALLAKPMAITLPVALLCLDLGLRDTAPAAALRKLLMDKLPWVGIAAGVAWLTLQAQSGALAEFNLIDRLLAALNSYGWYLRSTVWPVDLHFYYLSERALHPASAAVAVLMLTAISTWAILQRRQSPWILAGWLWFLLTLLPVAGFVKVGTQAYADRYVYLPHLGIAVMILALAGRQAPHRTSLWLASAAPVIAILAALAFRQTAVWQDTRTLYEHALSIEPRHYVAHMGLANLALRKGDHVAALRHADVALASSQGPSLVRAMRIVRGDVAMARGAPVEALAEYELAVAAEPQNGTAYLRAAAARLRLGDPRGAEAGLRVAAGLEGPSAEIAALLGASLGMQGRVSEALEVLTTGNARWPGHVGLQINLAQAALASGDVALAIASYQRALSLDPENSAARRGLAQLLRRPD